MLLEENTILFFDVYLNSSSGNLTLISPWIVYVLFAAVASLMLIAGAVSLVKRPEK